MMDQRIRNRHRLPELEHRSSVKRTLLILKTTALFFVIFAACTSSALALIDTSNYPGKIYWGGQTLSYSDFPVPGFCVNVTTGGPFTFPGDSNDQYCIKTDFVSCFIYPPVGYWGQKASPCSADTNGSSLTGICGYSQSGVTSENVGSTYIKCNSYGWGSDTYEERWYLDIYKLGICSDGQTKACSLNDCNGTQTCSGSQWGTCQVDESQTPPEECKMCSSEGKVNKAAGTACGTTECNPFSSDTDPDTCPKKTCKFCNDGSCMLGPQPPPQNTTCAADDYDCQIKNILKKYTGVAEDPRYTTNGKHCGMLNCNIVGCIGVGATEATCRPVSRSLHYCNKARDYRSKDKCDELKNAITGDLQASMRKAFVESAGTDSEHFHIEFPGPAGEQCRNGVLCGGAGQPACEECSWEPIPFGQRPPRDAITARLNGRLHVLMCTEP